MELKYGRSVQTAGMPASWNIQRLRPAMHTEHRDEAAVVSSALDSPIASPRLHDFLRPDYPLTIIVSDKTRKCRTDLFLPLILDRVHSAGVDVSDVTILFAAGTHPAQSEIEQREILGSEVFDQYRIEEHQCRRDDTAAPEWVHAGTTRFGTEILLNPLVAGERNIIATGTIVHHYFAGFGGGPKLFVPGCAAYETAVQNHRRTLLGDGTFHRGCSDGSVKGNPVIEDIQDAVRFFPPTFYFAALLGEHGRIVDAVSGDLLKAHAAGSRKVDEMYRVPVPSLADLTIVSAGGFPKDINFIQAHKAIHHAHYATREGGTIICLAECGEGLGNSQFLSWFKHESDSDFRQRILREYSMNAHTAVSLREKTKRCNIILVSSLDPGAVRQMGMHPAANFKEALGIAEQRQTGGKGGADHPTVYVIENGSLTVPVFRAG